MGKCTFTTTIVLIGAENQKGGLYFYKIEKYNDPDSFTTAFLKKLINKHGNEDNRTVPVNKCRNTY